MAKTGRGTYVDAQVYAMLEAIRKRVERDPGWRVVARGRDWLCPYCGEVGFCGYDEHKAPREMLRHLLNDCPHWSEESGTRFSHKLLVAKARRIEREELLRTQRGWRMADKLGHWYCPYCAQATDVPWRADSKEPSPPLERVHAHLEKCPGNRNGRKPYSAEALHLVVEDADRYREVTVGVRCKMEQEPGWRQMTRDGKWLCPRCRQVVPEVDLSSDAERVALAPVRIARHLMERCRPRAAGAPGAAPSVEPVAQTTPSPEPEPESDAGLLILRSTSVYNLPPVTPDATPAPTAPPAAPAPPDDKAREEAREAFREVLPGQPPILDGYDIHCFHHPAADVGGTFYDYFYVSPENLAVVVCGLPARGEEAVRSITAFRKSLRYHSQHHQSPAEVLRRTNQDIVAHHNARAFITALYGVLDAHAGSFTYARAGHTMPILFNRQDEPPVRELSSTGLALGIQEGAGFDETIEDVAIRFRPGDALVLYAGGVTEAEGSTGERYGIARLGATIERPYGALSSQALATAIFEDVSQFLGQAPQKDDVTIFCLRKP
ncbi:MAG TPA: SpoIIE family protein phosphatase [Planctomycetota bacterium]|nr:SpoIIE family protein phosphatase [Planctomycetota bacterium]